jgi:hypothetical protein
MELWIGILEYVMLAVAGFGGLVLGGVHHQASRGEVVGYAITVTQCLAAKGALYVSRCGNA